ncbi:MAG: hypothetical protein GZ091_19105 [Paludibacter sp.]|nr:hypothetical protein [Paludibacter sp.]
MVDKELNFLSKNTSYGVVDRINPIQNIEHNIVYSDGSKLGYGDKAEIFGAISNIELISFMDSVLSNNNYTKEHYWITFGYQPASFDDEEIKDREVRIHYAGVDNTIPKKDFYELCLLLCMAKLNGFDLNEVKNLKQEELKLIKVRLEKKVKNIL